MADIADYDKHKMKNLALIQTLENEMLHKFKELSGQMGDNPGLTPIVDKYRSYLKNKKAEALAMQDYFQSLLMSLHSLTPPPAIKSKIKNKTNTKSNTHKSNRRGGGGGGGGDDADLTFFFNKLVTDERAIMNEIHKWGDQFNQLKEF